MKRIVGILICMLLITTTIPLTVMAGDEENPEIQDETEDNIADYLNIISAWFYENPDEPNYLFISLKLKEINNLRFKQHLTIHWKHDNIECAAGMFIGYGSPWMAFSAGYGHGFWFNEHYVEITGEYNLETNIFTCKIPKEVINNPKQGDILTNTYALTFQRFGFIGRLGFDRIFIPYFMYLFTDKWINDYAPADGEYGRDYIIQY